MNRLGITLNDGRRFVYPAAMAAVLVLLAGGANALAYGVHCVPKLSVNASCTDYYTTISAAVTAASSGDIIVVGPGKYNESVTINTDSLSLFGAQAGNDARVGRQNQAKESIVDGTGTAKSTIVINAPFVAIDGFTVQGGTVGALAGGIYLTGADAYGAEVLNNIIQNNSNGVCPMGSSELVIEHNLFRNNNVGTGSYVGYGIYAYDAGTLGITDNEFTGNQAAAVYVDTCEFVVITNNSSCKDGAFVSILSTSNLDFSHNQGINFGAKPLLGLADAAVSIGYGNQNLAISDNSLEEGEGSISHGVAFTTAFGTSADSEGVVVKNNTIVGFKGNGIVAETDTTVSPTLGMTRYSSIVGNEVRDNGLDGISIKGADVYNTNISLFDNEAEGNHVFDCQDTSTGTGYTLGTHNTWFNNIGNLSSPNGLCTPGRGHDH